MGGQPPLGCPVERCSTVFFVTADNRGQKVWPRAVWRGRLARWFVELQAGNSARSTQAICPRLRHGPCQSFARTRHIPLPTRL
jgi:hypothetical protein